MTPEQVKNTDRVEVSSFLHRLAFSDTNALEVRKTHFSSTARGGNSYTSVGYVQSAVKDTLC